MGGMKSTFWYIRVFHLWILVEAVAAGSKPAESFHAEATLIAGMAKKRGFLTNLLGCFFLDFIGFY